MAQFWFIVRDGGEDGPYSATELKVIAAGGRLGPDDLVRRDDRSDPVPVSRVRGLIPDPAPQAAGPWPEAVRQAPATPTATPRIVRSRGRSGTVGPTRSGPIPASAAPERRRRPHTAAKVSIIGAVLVILVFGGRILLRAWSRGMFDEDPATHSYSGREVTSWDRQMRPQLVGTWVHHTAWSDKLEDGREVLLEMSQENHLDADGSWSATFVYEVPEEDEEFSREVNLSGVWAVEGAELVFVIRTSSAPEDLDPGTYMSWKILEVTPTSGKFRDTSDDTIYRARRN